MIDRFLFRTPIINRLPEGKRLMMGLKPLSDSIHELFNNPKVMLRTASYLKSNRRSYFTRSAYVLNIRLHCFAVGSIFFRILLLPFLYFITEIDFVWSRTRLLLQIPLRYVYAIR
ncbi:hypothetical protein Tcan_01171, partial [Toxocara canis]